MRHLRNHLRFCKIRIFERLRDIQNGCDRHYAVELVEPVAGRLLAKFAIKDFRQSLAIGVTQGRRVESRFRFQVRSTDGIGEFEPEFVRSEEHTSELQSQFHLVCRLLLEKKKK